MSKGNARAYIEFLASDKKLPQGLARVRSKLNAFASGISKAFTKSRGNAGEIAKNAIGHFAGNVATRGLDVLVDAAQGVVNFERNLTRLQISTGKTPAQMAAMREAIRRVSRETAISSDEILAGASTYVAITGDAEGAQAAMAQFARIAQATGATVSDVATAAAAFRTSANLNADDIEAAFSAMAVQGKAGAVEVKDLAAELSELMPQFAQFRGAKSLDGIREMGAAFQVIRKGAGSASGAATQFQALMGELANPATVKDLKKVGIAVFDNNGKMRSASEIFEAIATNSKLADPRKIAAIFGRKESQAAVRSLREHIGLFRDLKVAGQDAGAIERDRMIMAESAAGKIDAAFNNMKLSLAETFTPERIEAFAGALGKAVDMFAKIVGFVDKTAKFVSDVVEKVQGPSVEKLTGRAYDRLISQEGKEAKNGMFDTNTRAGAEQMSRIYFEQAAQAYVTPGGMDEHKQATYEAYSRRAHELRDKADPWGTGIESDSDRTTKENFEIFKSSFGEEKARTVAAENFVFGMKVAIRDALKEVAIRTEIGRDKVVEATRTSSKQRTRP
ncbi:MAG: phage tail tape measure protein [Kofleriaceae bacterium]